VPGRRCALLLPCRTALESPSGTETAVYQPMCGRARLLRAWLSIEQIELQFVESLP
jgi:hypothetical protein